jgi:lipid A 3-O-deacylase
LNLRSSARRRPETRSIRGKAFVGAKSSRVVEGLTQRSSIRALTAVAGLVSTIALAFPTQAQEPASDGVLPLGGWVYEMRAGLLAHDVDDLWSRSRREDGVDISAEVVFAHAGLPLLFGHLRPNLGVTVNTQGDTSKLYTGGLMEWTHPAGLFLDAGIGAAVHDGKTNDRRSNRKPLGSRVLFRLSLDLGWTFRLHHRLMLSFDHISNAGLASPNDGLDTLGVRYGYRF